MAELKHFSPASQEYTEKVIRYVEKANFSLAHNNQLVYRKSDPHSLVKTAHIELRRIGKELDPYLRREECSEKFVNLWGMFSLYAGIFLSARAVEQHDFHSSKGGWSIEKLPERIWYSQWQEFLANLNDKNLGTRTRRDTRVKILLKNMGASVPFARRLLNKSSDGLLILLSPKKLNQTEIKEYSQKAHPEIPKDKLKDLYEKFYSPKQL